MKRAATLLLTISLATTLALAQNQYVKNIVVIMQENRTPDNLFQALCTGNNCGTGTNQFDIASGGKCLYQGTEYNIPLKAISLINCSDPGHHHGDWTHMYHNNGMDGACTYSQPCKTGSLYQCPAPISNLDCTRYTYVDNSSGAIQPTSI
jgi:phospholipase C